MVLRGLSRLRHMQIEEDDVCAASRATTATYSHIWNPMGVRSPSIAPATGGTTPFTSATRLTDLMNAPRYRFHAESVITGAGRCQLVWGLPRLLADVNIVRCTTVTVVVERTWTTALYIAFLDCSRADLGIFRRSRT